jgi:hypothetical protein
VRSLWRWLWSRRQDEEPPRAKPVEDFDAWWLKHCLADEERRTELAWQRIYLEDMINIYGEKTMTTNNGTMTVTKEKIEMAREGWAALGGVEPTEVQAWIKQRYSVEASIGTILKAKPDSLKKGGGKKDSDVAAGEVTATELRNIKSIAAEGEGLAELEALLAKAQAVADAAGGLERAREVAAVLRELTTK